MARAFLILFLAATAACTTTADHGGPVAPLDLVSGSALGLQNAPEPGISGEQIVALDAEMRHFVVAAVGASVDPAVRLKKLLDAMQQRGLFEIAYSESVNLTARETFYARRGNCLSFTMMFVAMAREAGLDVGYQMVDVPPRWTNEDDLMVVGNHINAVVVGRGNEEFVVDFNQTEFSGNYRRRNVTDDYALALFFNNLGAVALIEADFPTSFRYFREAYRIHPAIPGLWANLGLMYSRQGHYDHAQAAYRQALRIDSRDRSALTNLASLHASLGNHELAAEYTDRIRSYQQRNPYYHYRMAEMALRDGRLENALIEIKRAERLKRDEPAFHLLSGEVYLGLGQDADAETSFARGRVLTQAGAVRERYDARVRTAMAAAATDAAVAGN